MIPFPAVPRLVDEAVVLRPLQASDADAVFEACHEDREILRWAMRPVPFTRDAADEWLRDRDAEHKRGERITFAIAERSSDRLIGAVWLGRFDREALRAEFGYWVAAAARGKGAATRAVSLVSRWGFDALDLVRLQILTPTKNPASRRVAERAGFRNEGVLRAYRNIGGEKTDLVMHSLLASDLQDE